MAQQDERTPADDDAFDPKSDAAESPPASGVPNTRPDGFPDDNFIDTTDAPHEIALQTCPFCSRATRADADVCHRCGNFLLRDEEASRRFRERILRWVVAMALFAFAAWVLWFADLIR
jgi:predicted nucleic acid-binding Zn ribbon protein